MSVHATVHQSLYLLGHLEYPMNYLKFVMKLPMKTTHKFDLTTTLIIMESSKFVYKQRG